MSARATESAGGATFTAAKLLYDVMRAVESVFGVPTHRLLGPGHHREVSEARHAVFYIALHGLKWPAREIAACLNRDRTMCNHSKNAAEDLIASYPEYAKKVGDAARIAGVDISPAVGGNQRTAVEQSTRPEETGGRGLKRSAENANDTAVAATTATNAERDGGRDRTIRLRLARSRRVRGGRTFLAMKSKET